MARTLTDGELDIMAELNADAAPMGWCHVCRDEPTDACQLHTADEVDQAEDEYRAEMEDIDRRGFGFSF